jgi:translocation and assembly module TamB
VALGISAFTVFVLSVLVFFYSARIRNQLLHIGQLALLDRTGLAVQVQGARMELFPPRLRVFGVSVRRPGESPFFRAEEIAVAPGLTRSLGGRIAFDWVELRSPQLDLTYADGEIVELHGLIVKGSDDRTSVRLPIELWGGLITRAQVRLTIPGRAVIKLVGVNVFAAPSAAGTTSLEMVVPPASIVLPSRTVALHDLKLGLLIKGTNLLAPKEVLLRQLEFISDVASLESAGSLDMETQSAAGNLHFNLDLEVVHALFPETPPLSGRLAVGATLHTGSKPATLDLDLDGADISAAGIPIGNVQAQLSASTKSIDIHQLLLRAASGEARVSGHLTPALDFPLQLQVRWTGLELAEILDALGLKDPWVVLRSSGNARLAGHLKAKSLTDPMLSGNVHIDIPTFTSRDRSFRLGDYMTILQMYRAQIDTKLTLFSDRLELQDAHIKGEPGKMDLEARFYFDQELGFHINGESDQLDMEKFGKIADIALKGIGPLRFSLGGPYGPPAIDAQVTLEGASIGGVPLGDLDSRVLFRDGHTLEFPDAVATYENSVAEGHGAVDLVPLTGHSGPLITVAGSMSHGEIADMRQLLPLPPELLDDFSGDVSGTFKISGLAAAPNVDIDFKSDGFEIVGQPFAASSGAVSLEHGRFARLQAEAALGSGTATVAIEGEREGVSLDVDLEALPVSELRFLQGARKQLGGSISGSGSGRWGKQRLGEGSIKISHFRIANQDEGELAATLTLNGDALRADFSAFDAHGKGEARLDWSGRPSFTVAAKFAQADWSKYATLPPAYALYGSGELALSGELSSLDTMRGTASLRGLRFVAPEFELDAKTVTALTLADRRVTLSGLGLIGRGSDIAVTGNATLDGKLDGQLQGEISADILQPMIPHIEVLSGTVPMNLAIGGSIGDIDVSGKASLDHGRLKFDFFNDPVTELAGQLNFSGHTLLFENLSGELGGGEVAGNGELRMEGGAFSGLSFDFDLDEVNYTAPGDIPLRASGRLKVDGGGEGKGFDVTGAIRIAELRYTRDLALDSLLPSFKKKPTATRTLERAGEQVTFNVDIKSDGTIFINDNLANAQLKADLRLVGTNVRTGMLGTLTLQRGQLYFNNVTYDVQSGVIDFIDRFQLFPRFDFRLRAEACGAQISVNLSGTVDDPHADPRGRDANSVLTQEDVLSCLTLGYRASDQSRAGVTGSTGAQQAGVSMLSTVTGLDQKIKRLIPVDQIRFGYGFSLRSLKNTPQVTVTKDLAAGIQLRLTSSLIDANDQVLELKWPSSPYTDLTMGWTNATEIPNDIGLDMRAHFAF